MKSLPAIVAVLVLAGCVAETSGPEDDEATATDEGAAVECKGPFDCKLPNQGAANANRATNPADGSDRWPIRAGAHLYDGFGHARGVITNTQIGINYGQRKHINSDTFVYAFGVHLDTGINASGWIRQSNVLSDVASMPTVSADNPGSGDYQHDFIATGGDPAKYGDLKVVKSSTSTHEAASDYLKREGDVFNLLYNLPGVGGVSTDTLPIGAPFHRSLGVLSVDIPLYHPKSSKVVGSMKFVYGHVGSRWGWVARDAIE